MTKANMPVSEHRMSRTEDVRARKVWTEELTFYKASADCVDPSGVDPYGPSGRARSWGTT